VYENVNQICIYKVLLNGLEKGLIYKI